MLYRALRKFCQIIFLRATQATYFVVLRNTLQVNCPVGKVDIFNSNLRRTILDIVLIYLTCIIFAQFDCNFGHLNSDHDGGAH